MDFGAALRRGGRREAELTLAPDAEPNRLLAALMARGTVRRFEVRAPSLHEIFKRVAGDASPREPA